MFRKLALLLIAALVAAIFTSGPAAASHSPSLHQLRHWVTALDKQEATLDQQYDQDRQQVASAAAQVRTQDREVRRMARTVAVQREQALQIAITYYEDQGQTSPEALLTSSRALAVLSQSSVLQELSREDVSVLRGYDADVRELAALQALQRRYADAEHTLKTETRALRKQLSGLQRREDTYLRQLTPTQQAGTGPGSGTSVPGSDTVPTSSQAGRAVAYAYAQLGCPYVWGGTGPCSAGFDCSGLVMESWAYAGVSIPRTSEEQWASLPAVPVSQIQPGDLIIMLDGDHVGMYVGDGYLIQAPQTGEDVQRVPYTGWFVANTVGIVRP